MYKRMQIALQQYVRTRRLDNTSTVFNPGVIEPYLHENIFAHFFVRMERLADIFNMPDIECQSGLTL